jgi:hypothetical protein
MGDSLKENSSQDPPSWRTEISCCEDVSLTTQPTVIFVQEIERSDVQNVEIQMVPIAQDESMDSISVIPYCTVLFDGNKDAENATSEVNQREIAAPVAGLPYSPPDLRRPFKPSNSKRQQLIAKEAAEIYLLRPKSKAGKLIPRGSMAHCKVMSESSHQ